MGRGWSPPRGTLPRPETKGTAGWTGGVRAEAETKHTPWAPGAEGSVRGAGRAWFSGELWEVMGEDSRDPGWVPWGGAGAGIAVAPVWKEGQWC